MLNILLGARRYGLSMVVVFFGAPTWAASDFNSKVDMLDYLSCTEQQKKTLGSDRGLYVGEIYQGKNFDKRYNGTTLYACPKDSWILFNPENQIMASHFGVSKKVLAQRCTKQTQITVTEIWEKETVPTKKFGVIINCEKLKSLL